MIRLFLLFVFFSSLQTSCVHGGRRTDNEKFSTLTREFLENYWKTHPGLASSFGLTRYDSVLEIPDQKNRDKKLQFYKKYLRVFGDFNEDGLSVTQSVDRRLILNKLEKGVWSIEVFKAHEWNPALFNLGWSISTVLDKQKISLDERLKALNDRLLRVPEFYNAVRGNIKRPTREHLKLAIQQTRGVERYLNTLIARGFESSGLSRREKQSLNQRIKASKTLTRRHLRFLKRILANPRRVGGFRSASIGPELYREKFNLFLQINQSPEQLYKKALEDKEEILSKMFELATGLYSKYYAGKLPPKDSKKVISAVIRKISKKHTKPKDFLQSIENQLTQLTGFVKQKNLLNMDFAESLEVRQTPPYQRGFSRISIDSPGPFDPARKTYYNVTPLDDLSKRERESYLREYNDYTLQILNIHEAIPGHYVQFVYSNKSQKSPVQPLFGNVSMVEGWAVYAERMMLEEGYGRGSGELWLMYYKWFLRVVTNTILDYEFHNKNLSKKEALKLMIDGAFQEKAQADEKWKRMGLSQVQLCSYFAGFTEIYGLREEIKTLQAEDFDLKNFHETFLSFGAISVKEIRELMLKK